MSDITYIFECEDSVEGILSAVYDAYASRLGHRNIRLKIFMQDTPELFAEYRTVVTDPDKSEKLRSAIMKKIGTAAWEHVYYAALSAETSKADDIYRFLIGGFCYGPRVLEMLTEPAVDRLLKVAQIASREIYYWREFLKFERLQGGILLARIRPKADAIPVEMFHFHDRMPSENFMIWDIGRDTAGIHPADGRWYLTSVTPELAARLKLGTDAYTDLWRTFFDAIAIKERYNPSCQRTHIPLHYRETLPEFNRDL